MMKDFSIRNRKTRNIIKYIYLALVSTLTLITLSDNVVVREDEIYSDVEHVAMYIYEYDKLPDNYVHKTLRNTVEGEDLYLYATFRNDEKLLPLNETYTEAYINATKSDPGKERLVYTLGVVYYTDDHYRSFDMITTQEIQRSFVTWIVVTSVVSVGTPVGFLFVSKKEDIEFLNTLRDDTGKDIQYIKEKFYNGFEKVKDYVIRITQ